MGESKYPPRQFSRLIKPSGRRAEPQRLRAIHGIFILFGSDGQVVVFAAHVRTTDDDMEFIAEE